jgi:sugar lactone lactonase YvrE
LPAYVTGACVGAALLAAAAIAADVRRSPDNPVARTGWSWRVAAENLAGVDNLALDEAGVLYATQELRRPAGRVIRLERGAVTTLISGLDRPDGLLWRGGFLFVTEEKPGGRVLEYGLTSKKLRTLATLSKPEGIDMFPNGDLLLSEDVMGGRLLRLRRDGRSPPEALLADLKRPEGLVIRPGGSIVFAETATGRVLSYHDGKLNVVIDGLAEPDQVELAPDGSLWITEDAENGRLLRFADGTLETILSGLRYPQGMAIGADGAVWLAEQGRRRILVVRRRDAGP